MTVKDDSADVVGRAFSSAAVELALASYPGFTLTSPPGSATPYGVYWPALVPAEVVEHVVVHHDGTREVVPHTPPGPQLPVQPAATPTGPEGPTRRVPLGTVVGARSGDKGGNANVGFWARTDAAAQWLLSWLDEKAFRALLRALAPFLAAQWLLLLLVLLFPQLTHVGQSAQDSSRVPAAPMSDEEFNRRLRDMIKLPELPQFDPPGEAERR